MASLADGLALGANDACAPSLTEISLLGDGEIAVCEEHVEQAITILEEQGSITW